ncbi:MAG TPA: hypothetical protein VGP03_13300 [Pseudonocardiaceae bacterium]|nr:hypothetical protein [Pseudonocardiaceae bacterium]
MILGWTWPSSNSRSASGAAKDLVNPAEEAVDTGAASRRWNQLGDDLVRDRGSGDDHGSLLQKSVALRHELGVVGEGIFDTSVHGSMRITHLGGIGSLERSL